MINNPLNPPPPPADAPQPSAFTDRVGYILNENNSMETKVSQLNMLATGSTVLPETVFKEVYNNLLAEPDPAKSLEKFQIVAELYKGVAQTPGAGSTLSAAVKKANEFPENAAKISEVYAQVSTAAKPAAPAPDAPPPPPDAPPQPQVAQAPKPAVAPPPVGVPPPLPADIAAKQALDQDVVTALAANGQEAIMARLNGIAAPRNEILNAVAKNIENEPDASKVGKKFEALAKLYEGLGTQTQEANRSSASTLEAAAAAAQQKLGNDEQATDKIKERIQEAKQNRLDNAVASALNDPDPAKIDAVAGNLGVRPQEVFYAVLTNLQQETDPREMARKYVVLSDLYSKLDHSNTQQHVSNTATLNNAAREVQDKIPEDMRDLVSIVEDARTQGIESVPQALRDKGSAYIQDAQNRTKLANAERKLQALQNPPAPAPEPAAERPAEENKQNNKEEQQAEKPAKEEGEKKPGFKYAWPFSKTTTAILAVVVIASILTGGLATPYLLGALTVFLLANAAYQGAKHAWKNRNAGDAPEGPAKGEGVAKEREREREREPERVPEVAQAENRGQGQNNEVQALKDEIHNLKVAALQQEIDGLKAALQAAPAGQAPRQNVAQQDPNLPPPPVQAPQQLNGNGPVLPPPPPGAQAAVAAIVADIAKNAADPAQVQQQQQNPKHWQQAIQGGPKAGGVGGPGGPG